eukprot:Pgem_evm1s14782
MYIGAGESGKSTVVKQMKIIHDDGYSDAERAAYKDVVCGNVVLSMQCILNAVQSKVLEPEVVIELKKETQEVATKILNLGDQIDNLTLDQDIASSIKFLWSCEEVQEAFSHSSKYQLNDSAK